MKIKQDKIKIGNYYFSISRINIYFHLETYPHPSFATSFFDSYSFINCPSKDKLNSFIDLLSQLEKEVMKNENQR